MWNEYEDRIIWDDLAPSLQAMIRNTQTSIEKLNKLIPIVDNLVKLGDTTITNNLVKLGDTTTTNNLVKIGGDTTITNNIVQMGSDTTLVNNITTIYGGGSSASNPLVSAEKGEVLKSNGSGGIMIGDIFKRVKMAGTSGDLDVEKTFTSVTLDEIMNEWKRYTHSYGPALYALDNSNSSTTATGAWSQRQNDWTQDGHRVYLDRTQTGWIVDKSVNMIQSTVDGYPVCGFISPKPSYYNYKFKCKIDTGWDDDNNGIVVGYCVDSNGREHTLTVMRGRGRATAVSNPSDIIYDPNASGIDTKFWWGLIYDAGNDTQDFLVNKSTTVGTGYYPGGNTDYCYITAERNDKTITAKTTRFSVDGSDNVDVPAWTFSWTLPATKPATMPAAEYDNLTTMLTGKNHVGFCVRSSNMAKFSIVSQEGIYTTMPLYDLTTNSYYEYDAITKTWVNKGDMGTEIPNRCFLYSEGTNHFYFYNYKNNFTKIF